MARIRSIHPGIYSDEAWASVSMAARWFAMGLCTEADDNGVFEWKPLQLKMRIFPGDGEDTAALLAQLSGAGIVRQFTLSGKAYGAIRNFCRYQRPRKPKSWHPIDDDIATFVSLQERLVPQKSEPDDIQEEPVPQKSEKSPQMEDEGGSRKREKEIATQPGRSREWLDKLEAECREAAGLVNDPSPSLYDLSPIVGLLDRNYDFSRDILPQLRKAKAKGLRPATWGYFIPGIEQSRAKVEAIKPNSAEVPLAEPKSVWLADTDPRWSKISEAVYSKTGKRITANGSREQKGIGAYVPVEFIPTPPPRNAA